MPNQKNMLIYSPLYDFGLGYIDVKPKDMFYEPQ